MMKSMTTPFNWIFTSEKSSIMQGTLDVRQKLAVLIHDLGRELQIPAHCIVTAVFYMHRYYMIHPWDRFLPERVATAAIFLACKEGDAPQELRQIIRSFLKILKIPNVQDLSYYVIEHYATEIVTLEDILLSTFGFQLSIQHPHQIIKGKWSSVEGLIQLSSHQTLDQLKSIAFQLAIKSTMITSFCVRYKPEWIAAFSIELACSWPRFPVESEIKSGISEWLPLLDNSLSKTQVYKLIDEFQTIFNNYPDRWKKKFFDTNECLDRVVLSTKHLDHSTSAKIPVSSVIPLADKKVPEVSFSNVTEAVDDQSPKDMIFSPCAQPLVPASHRVSPNQPVTIQKIIPLLPQDLPTSPPLKPDVNHGQKRPAELSTESSPTSKKARL